MQDDIVIKVDGVYKDFVLPHERAGSVKNIFTSMFRHATSKKEKQHALKDISLEIKKGEFFGIVGRNGSGKSTLLKILASIYQPTKGSVQVSGRLVPFIELGVGFNPELTGRDNIYLNGAMLGFSTKEVDAMYDEIVAFAELERFMDQKLKNYSSGMQVRLAFSMAVRAEADILLIDEVLAVGDADFQKKCFNYFRELKKVKKTVVFVSHDMNAVREYCDRAILIDESKVISEGKANDIAKEYSLLFIETQGSSSRTSIKDTRWGTGQVKFTEITVEPKVVSTDKDIEIKCRAIAHKDLDEIIFGFLIKNAAGQNLLGTNTQIKREKIVEVKKGDKLEISWRLPNVFADGTYLVDPAIVQFNGEVCDWWEDAAEFTVNKEDHSGYIVDPSIGLDIKQKVA